jgi:phage replication initiation protein
MAELAGILRGYVAFRQPTGHSNRSRWPIAPWWGEFLGGAGRAQLGRRETDRTVEGIQDWIARQVAPSLAVLVEVMGFDEAWCWLYQQVEEAMLRLGPRHRAIIAAAIKDQDLEMSEEAQ